MRVDGVPKMSLSLSDRLALEHAQHGVGVGLGLSPRAGYRLDRALGRRLCNQHGSGQNVRVAVRSAILELHTSGADDDEILALLQRLVEHTAWAHGLAKRSILTGRLDWIGVQSEVVDFARHELRTPEVRRD